MISKLWRVKITCIDQLLKENTLTDQLNIWLKDSNGHLITEDRYNCQDNKENQFKVDNREQKA